MDRLPDSLLLEILNRLNDSTDLARCRLVSKTLNTLSYNVQSLKIICSYDQFLKSKAPESQITPFKSIVKKLLLSSRNLETISLGVDDSLQNVGLTREFQFPIGIVGYGNELYLMDDDFVSEWLPQIDHGRLRSISISDFLVQSHSRVSNILSFISSTCNNLVELKLTNAWLSAEGLKPMSTLTSLTLHSIKLDDEDLNMVNKCFPFLRVLKLSGILGLREPNIHLLHLQNCKLFLGSLVSLTIHTPNLMKLKLSCEPMRLVLRAPLLSFLWFKIETASELVFEAEKFPNLKSLLISSYDFCNLIKLFPVCDAVEYLVWQAIKLDDDELETITIADANCKELMNCFPNVSVLQFLFGVRNQLNMCFSARDSEARNGWKRLKILDVCFDARLVISDMEGTRAFISHILKNCPTLSDMSYDHNGISPDVASNLIASCMRDCPWVEGRRGMWKRQIY